MADEFDWRAGILASILRVVFVLGLVVGTISSVWAIADGQPIIAVIDAVAIMVLGTIAFARGLAYRTRAVAFLALTFALGLWFLVNVGVVSQVYLMAVPVLTALLLGLRPAIVALALCAIALGIVGTIASTSETINLSGVDSVGEWVVVVANFLFVSAVLATSCAVLLGRLERSLADRRRAEAEAARLVRAIDQSTEAVLLADPDGSVTYANEAHAVLVDRIGDPHEITDLARLRAAAGVAVGPLDAWRGQVIIAPRTDAGHEEVELVVQVTPVADADGAVTNLVATMREVTLERTMERRLRQAEKLESLGTLASGVAHDFNNVVAAILAAAENLHERVTDGDLRDDVDVIVTACERARDVVRQMMVFGRRSVADGRPVSVSDAVRAARPFLRAAIGTRVEIREELTSVATVLAGVGDVHQMLANLVGNAAQAIADRNGSIVIRTSDVVADEDLAAMHPGLVADREYALLTVSDDGPGIPRTDIDRIFDPFFTTKPPTEGTGLGLSSVHAIVTALDGAIGVYSEVGVGTAFRIYLPSHEAMASPDAIERAAPDAISEQLRILLVDDETAIARLTAQGLELAGHVVTVAEDGHEATRRFDESPDSFDVLVTDLTMPGLDGASLIRHVRQQRPGLPAVLMSGFSDARPIDDLIDSGPVVFLAKPFMRHKLHDAISRAITLVR